MAKLIGSGSQGASLKASFQAKGETAAEKGFKHVNRSWFDRCKPLTDVIHALATDHRKIDDKRLPLKAVRPQLADLDGKGPKFCLNLDGDLYVPTEWACQKIGGWLDIPTHLFPKLTGPDCDTMDHELMVRHVANQMRKVDKEKVFMWRTWNDGTLRAMLSERYAVINNQWYLETIAKVVPDAVVSHWNGDADTIYGNILIPDSVRQEEDSEYGGGMSLSNCEVGQRRLTSLAWLFSIICWNGNIWDKCEGRELSQVHKGHIDLNVLGKALQRTINDQIPLITAGLDLFLAKRDFTTDVDVKPVVAQIARDHKLTKAEAFGVLQGYNIETRERPTVAGSLFGIIHGITRAAQVMSNQRWVALDTIGGALTRYTHDDWTRTTKAAASLPAKTVDDTFLVSV